MLLGLVRRDRVGWWVLLALWVSLIPVAWKARALAHIAGGRLDYGPALWVLLLMGLGLHHLVSGRAVSLRAAALRALGGLLAAGLVAMSLSSLHYQTAIWNQASLLARAAVTDFAPHATGSEGPPLHLRRMPFQFEEGPYILKAYAFPKFYGQDRVPPLVADRRLFRFRDGRVIEARVRPAHLSKEFRALGPALDVDLGP